MRTSLVSIAAALLLAVGGCNLSGNGNPPDNGAVLQVDAGEDVTVRPETAITLTATAEGGLEPYFFRWSIESQPADAELSLGDASTNSVLEAAGQTVEGRYTFRVRVTDSNANTAVSFVTVTVKEALQITVHTDAPLRVVGETVQLSAALVDTTGLENISYAWAVVSGEAELADVTSSGTQATIQSASIVQIEVTVTAEENGVADSNTAGLLVVGVDSALPRVVITNTGGVEGDIVLELLTEAAPGTCANFLRYTDERFYDGILWHRAISGFVVQGGGYERGEGAGLVKREDGLRDAIPGEAPNGESNVRATVAMALLGQDANSATSQFYVNLDTNGSLDEGPPAFTVFARVVEGMDLVDEIAGLETETDEESGMTDVPTPDVVMVSVRRESELAAPTDTPATDTTTTP